MAKKRKKLADKEVNQIARRIAASIIWNWPILELEKLTEEENERVGRKIVALSDMLYPGDLASDMGQVVEDVLNARK
jgi:hypothetical protein